MIEDPLLVSRAIVVWSAAGRTVWPPYPGTNSLLVEEFGADEASRLLPLVRELRDEFFACDAKWTIENRHMADATVGDLQNRYRGISNESVEMLIRLKNGFYAPNAKWPMYDEKKMVSQMAEKFRQHYPEITDEAVQALANWYMFASR